MLSLRVHSSLKNLIVRTAGSEFPLRPGLYAPTHGVHFLVDAATDIATMLFRVCRKGSPAKWTVVVEGQSYGEYLDKDQALIDAIEAAKEACEAGTPAEVWEGAVRVY